MSGLTLAQFADAAGSRMLDEGGALPLRPSTDSRTLQRGDTFVCLRGPNFDGHDFIVDALAKGAAALVVERPEKVPASAGVPVVIVADVKQAYLAGAAATRRGSQAMVVGVTGSNGKTTTKEFARQLIGRHRRVLASPQNENNELGVAHVCYALADGAEVAVIEMGARHPGEIAQLVEIARPDVGVLTNVGEAHLEFFADQEELARTKFAIFGHGARAVCSAADGWSRRLAAEAGMEKHATWVRLCGDSDAPGLVLEAGVPRDGRVALTLGASHAFAQWHLIGEQHLRDALLAVAAGVQCGIEFERAIEGLGDLRLPPGRFEMHALPGGALIVFDAYNASPTAVAHALRAFCELPAQRRIAVLGSMAELGDRAAEHHEQTGAAVARCAIDLLYCGGASAQAMANGARAGGMKPGAIATFASNEDVTVLLARELREGDAVLIKGSRVEKMEQILDGLVHQKAS